MCVGGGRVRTAGETGQGALSPISPAFFHREKRPWWGGVTLLPSSQRTVLEEWQALLYSTPEIPAVVMWGHRCGISAGRDELFPCRHLPNCHFFM